MTEPALTPKQSEILRDLFVLQIEMRCSCDLKHHCFRCQYLDQIRTAFPATFTQACIDAAKVNPLEHDNG